MRTADGNFSLSARNLADTSLDFETIIVRQTPEGGVVRVGDVARVVDGFEDVNLYSRMNGEPSVMISIQTADKFNIWETNAALQEYLEEARAQLPEGATLTTIYNENEDFNALLDILFSNALQGFFLIFVLLMLTLHPKVAFWATAGVIVAFTGAFFILPYVDVSLNFLTVFGFLLVLGIMIDDAIIVGESIYGAPSAAMPGGRLDPGHAIGAEAGDGLGAHHHDRLQPAHVHRRETRQFTRAISVVVMSTLFFSLLESLLILPAHLAHLKPINTEGKGLWPRLMRIQQTCAIRSFGWPSTCTDRWPSAR